MVVYGRETDVDSAENAAVVVFYYVEATLCYGQEKIHILK